MGEMTHSSLITSLKDYLARDDFTDQMAMGWMSFAEAKLNQTLRCKSMEKDATLSKRTVNSEIDVSENTYGLPDDYLSSRQVYNGGKVYQVYMKANPVKVKKAIKEGEYEKAIFCIMANFLIANPAAEKLKIIYLSKIPPLTADDDTNWLTRNHPGLMLNAVLAQACLCFRDEEGAALYGGMADGDIKEINDMEDEDQSLDPVTYSYAGEDGV